ncbi:MAG: beta-sandwich domain-containing protein [Bdellovibrio sp.]|nr:beta-sandwich domain-containing protein [Bdellovibrio sp.]
MEHQRVLGFVASVLLLQTPGLASAQTNNYSGINNDLATLAGPQAQYEGVGRLGDITRQTGGKLYRLDAVKAVPLNLLKVRAKANRLKIYSVSLITENQERIAVKNLANATVTPDKEMASEALANTAAIAAIEIQAESIGGVANVEISAVSSVEAPQLNLKGDDDWGTCNSKLDPLLKDKLEFVQVWAGRAEASVAGSYQEKYANKQLNKYIGDFLSTLKGDKSAYSSIGYTLTLLNFFVERNNASRVGSEVDQGYNTLAAETFNVFLASFQSDQTCRFVASEELMNMAIDFQKRREGYKADSRASKIYEMYITKLAAFIPGQYGKEVVERNLSFRQADAEGYKFYQQFTQSKPENALKVMYQGVSASAYARAAVALTREVQSLNNEQTYQLIVEFQAKYNDSANYPQDAILKYLTILSEHHYFLRSLQVQ